MRPGVQIPARPGGRRRQGRLPGVVKDQHGRASRRPGGHGRRDPGQCTRAGAPADPGTGQAVAGRHGRGLRRFGLLPLFRQPRPAAAGGDRYGRCTGRNSSPTARRRGGHRALELPADPDGLQGARRAPGRQHRDPEAGRNHPAHHAAVRRTGEGSGPARRAERDRRRQRPGRRDDQAPGHPQDQLHRLYRDRQESDGQRRRRPEADLAGARRQRRPDRAG